MSKNAFLILVTMAAVLAAECSTTHIGGIRMSREVTGQFEKLEVKPDYRYWYLNQENSPYGVAGLDREYRLHDNRMWQARPLFWLQAVSLCSTFFAVAGILPSHVSGDHCFKKYLYFWNRNLYNSCF